MKNRAHVRQSHLHQPLDGRELRWRATEDCLLSWSCLEKTRRNSLWVFFQWEPRGIPQCSFYILFVTLFVEPLPFCEKLKTKKSSGPPCCGEKKTNMCSFANYMLPGVRNNIDIEFITATPGIFARNGGWFIFFALEKGTKNRRFVHLLVLLPRRYGDYFNSLWKFCLWI